MSKSWVLTGVLSTVFVLTLASSVKADKVHADLFLEKLIYAERHNLTVFDNQRAETGYLYAEHFENNNGRHRGFSMASQRRGLRPGSVKQQQPPAGTVTENPEPPAVTVTENPEPTAMVLLGTGLTALAALARRKKNRKRVR